MINKVKDKLFQTGSDKIAEAVKKNSGETGERVKHYIHLVTTGNVQGLFKALLDDMDKENILAEVRAQQSRHPKLSAQELSRLEINSTAKAMSGVAVGSGLSWVLPGVALLTGPLATAGEIIGLFVFQSRLVVKIAAYHGMDINGSERVRDVALCVACSSASIGGARFGGKALEQVMVKFGQKMAETASRRLAQVGIKALPGLGSLAGLAGGVVGAVTNYYSVKGVGAYALKLYGGREQSVEDNFDRAIFLVTILAARSRGELGNEQADFFKSLIANSTIGEQSKKDLLDKLNGEISLADIGTGFSYAEKRELIITALKICLRDDISSEAELRFIDSLGGYLG
ncbi:MAG: hypothetical protein OEV64_00865, partial [Desulfobulbaceae bacterium]|nr:hypothetical protein [Desulfobulbaceae bacterium]